MKLVIDASNIFSGGGLTHLKEFLKHAQPIKHDFEQVFLWASNKTLDKLSHKKWLNKKSHRFLNKGYFRRFLWRQFVLKPSLDKDTLLFIPGTGYVSGAGKVVTMCRNLLPLEKEELNRFYPSITWLRLMFLRFLHIKSFEKADGVIFLNEYCALKADELAGRIRDSKVIPHGVNDDFRVNREDYSNSDSFELLYVSTLDLYKHQWLIAEAVLKLRTEGIPVTLTLIGESYGSTDKKLKDILNKYPKEAEAIKWRGKVPYQQLNKFYKKADAFIYGSTCETFGMTLLEAMASSLPIACSNKSSMKGMLKDAGIYFNPEDVNSVKDAIIKVYNNFDLRKKKGKKAYEIASNYTWEKTVEDTFQYFSEV